MLYFCSKHLFFICPCAVSSTCRLSQQLPAYGHLHKRSNCMAAWPCWLLVSQVEEYISEGYQALAISVLLKATVSYIGSTPSATLLAGKIDWFAKKRMDWLSKLSTTCLSNQEYEQHEETSPSMLASAQWSIVGGLDNHAINCQCLLTLSSCITHTQCISNIVRRK